MITQTVRSVASAMNSPLGDAPAYSSTEDCLTRPDYSPQSEGQSTLSVQSATVAKVSHEETVNHAANPRLSKQTLRLGKSGDFWLGVRPWKRRRRTERAPRATRHTRIIIAATSWRRAPRGSSPGGRAICGYRLLTRAAQSAHTATPAFGRAGRGRPAQTWSSATQTFHKSYGFPSEQSGSPRTTPCQLK